MYGPNERFGLIYRGRGISYGFSKKTNFPQSIRTESFIASRQVNILNDSDLKQVPNFHNTVKFFAN